MRMRELRRMREPPIIRRMREHALNEPSYANAFLFCIRGSGGDPE